MSAIARYWHARFDGRRDEGAYTLFVLIFVFALFLMVGLSVDGGGRLAAQARADDIAAEAARAAGQAIDLPQAISGTADVVDPAAAQAAAQAYLADAGANGTADVVNGGHAVRVTVHLTYRPEILGAFHFGPWPVTGTATAQLLTG
ncbi:MAG TPA: pilus assembly protein TadG-related protein [Micromonosporaceae bacterium]|nr:pilus assembly protein TadG-related protein [Micromonosporaceae bacterium]